MTESRDILSEGLVILSRQLALEKDFIEAD